MLTVLTPDLKCQYSIVFVFFVQKRAYLFLSCNLIVLLSLTCVYQFFAKLFLFLLVFNYVVSVFRQIMTDLRFSSLYSLTMDILHGYISCNELTLSSICFRGILFQMYYSGFRVIASRILHEIFFLIGELAIRRTSLYDELNIPKLMIYSKLPFILF